MTSFFQVKHFYLRFLHVFYSKTLLVNLFLDSCTYTVHTVEKSKHDIKFNRNYN